MIDEEVFEGIAAVARSHAGVRAKLTPETHLLRDLQLDSLTRLTLVAELENHFRVCFDADDEHGIETIADLARLIQRRLQEEVTHG